MTVNVHPFRRSTRTPMTTASTTATGQRPRTDPLDADTDDD
jgi:hypothetical protein